MYMQAVTFRIVFVGVLGVAILCGAALRNNTVLAAPMSAPAAQAHAPATNAPSIVTLPTVQVRASAAAPIASARARSSAPRLVTQVPGTSTAPPAAHAASGSSLPTLRLDMPYYSLGKFLPRVGKE